MRNFAPLFWSSSNFTSVYPTVINPITKPVRVKVFYTILLSYCILQKRSYTFYSQSRFHVHSAESTRGLHRLNRALSRVSPTLTPWIDGLDWSLESSGTRYLSSKTSESQQWAAYQLNILHIYEPLKQIQKILTWGVKCRGVDCTVHIYTSLPRPRLDEILTLGNFVADVNWLNFLSLACTSLESNLTDAVTLLCKILTRDPEGGEWFFAHYFNTTILTGVLLTWVLEISTTTFWHSCALEYLECLVALDNSIVMNFVMKWSPTVDSNLFYCFRAGKNRVRFVQTAVHISGRSWR